MEEKTATAESRAAGCFVCETVKPFLEHCWSDATRDHFRTSRVEFLKGIRSLLDARIDRLSREPKKGTHVTVE
jgi:predicted amidohydrolase